MSAARRDAGEAGRAAVRDETRPDAGERDAVPASGRPPVVVVTGGTAGVGRATVRAFARRGWDVGVLARGEDGIHLTMVQLPALDTPQFGWCRAKLPDHPQPVPPIYAPEVAAEAIVHAATAAPRELWLGTSTWKTILGQRVAPGFLDRYLATAAWEGQQTDEPVDPERPSNLFEPVPGDRGARGGFGERARTRSATLWISEHRRVLLGTALGLVGAPGAVLIGGRQR